MVRSFRAVESLRSCFPVLIRVPLTVAMMHAHRGIASPARIVGTGGDREDIDGRSGEI